VLEESDTPIFKVEEYAKQETSVKQIARKAHGFLWRVVV
jgi:hypothetical protein